MASLVLTDSSQLTSGSQHLDLLRCLHGLMRLCYTKLVMAGDCDPNPGRSSFRDGRRVENNSGKINLNTPDQDSNLASSVIGSSVYCEGDTLEHAATEAGNSLECYQHHIGHREQINSTIYQSAVPQRIPVYRQEVKTCHIALISGIKIGSALNAVKGTAAIILSL
uniref:Uncharacterized protein n=1 Tax=Timema monikensis TaxID=170555 RepID=A0A7R9HWI2_9NEOP|nr:unnamed protein product [Timema monikensis]